MQKVIKLHENDNVLVVIAAIDEGETIVVAGKDVVLDKGIHLGHKIALRRIDPGEKIIKNGFPIGSATRTIEAGAHIHLHNMKSDYIPTYTLDKSFKE